MYLWQIEYNDIFSFEKNIPVVNRFKLCIFDRLNTTNSYIIKCDIMLWIALNYVSLTDWIQRHDPSAIRRIVVNRFKLCIFDRLNTTLLRKFVSKIRLWIALNYVSLTDWIQPLQWLASGCHVVNRFKLCIFDRLNTTPMI